MLFNSKNPKQVPAKVCNFDRRHSHRTAQLSSLFMVNVVAFIAVIAASLATFSSARAEVIAPLVKQSEIQDSVNIQTPDYSGLKAAGPGSYSSEVGSTLLPETTLAANQVQVEFPVVKEGYTQDSGFGIFSAQKIQRLELGKFAILMALVVLFGSMVMVTSMLWQLSGREWKNRNFSIRAFASEQALH